MIPMLQPTKDLDEERRIAYTDFPRGAVKTQKTDEPRAHQQPYETLVAHSDYNDGGYTIVEGYPSQEEAILGHTKWHHIMLNPLLRKALIPSILPLP